MSSPWVVPALDVAEQGHAGLGLGFKDVAFNQFTFERGEEALGHGIVVGIAHAAGRRFDTHFRAALAEGHAGVLATLVAMMNDLIRLAQLQRHVQRGPHQVGRHAFANEPSHHTPAPDIEHDGQVDEPRPGWHVGHVRHPQLARRARPVRPGYAACRKSGASRCGSCGYVR